MDAGFWHERWETNDIAFHKKEANPLLVRCFAALSLSKGSRVFVPLCGKTLDIHWLLSEGFRVAGAELSKVAIEQLFTELGVEPKVSRDGEVDHYSAANIDVFVGDIFQLSSDVLGPVDAVYDRAALVALPEEVRKRYTAHLTALTSDAPQLLITYEYDQSLMEGPPFSINNEEVNRHYRESYEVSMILSADVPGGLKGKCAAKENVWLLREK
ncbi:thiopurine S-methyltransferase [Nitrospira sp. Nam80]